MEEKHKPEIATLPQEIAISEMNRREGNLREKSRTEILGPTAHSLFETRKESTHVCNTSCGRERKNRGNNLLVSWPENDSAKIAGIADGNPINQVGVSQKLSCGNSGHPCTSANLRVRNGPTRFGGESSPGNLGPSDHHLRSNYRHNIAPPRR